jgi:hypothetical protein
MRARKALVQKYSSKTLFSTRISFQQEVTKDNAQTGVSLPADGKFFSQPDRLVFCRSANR